MRRLATIVGEVGEGNRKDIRNAVKRRARREKWSQASTHNRAQVLYLSRGESGVRADEFAQQLVARETGATEARGAARKWKRRSRVCSPTRAWADKFDGAVHTPPLHGVALAMHEPLGVIGIACPDEAPLLGFVSLVAPALAMGNRVVVVPSETCPLDGDGLLSGRRDVGCARRRAEYRHRRTRARCCRRSRNTTTSMRSGASTARRIRRWSSVSRSAI